jgi:choline kinase
MAVLCLQAAGTVAALALVNPAPLLSVGRRFGSLPSSGILARVASRLRPLTEVPPLTMGRAFRLSFHGTVSVLLGIGMCHALALGLGLEVTFLALCLVVPLVWIVRLLPVSLNGIGVGEGAFVFLLGLFAVPKGQALALALVVLGLQSSLALVGGLLLVIRLVRPANARKPLDIADVPVALLAGGLATRLRPITTTIPKALVEVAGRPFIDHQLGLLKRNGIRRVVLCLGYLGEQVEAHLGDGSAFGMELLYSHDGDKLLGTGGALRGALPLLGEAFWVMYGDSYMDIDYRAVLADFAGRDVLGLMTVLHNNNSWDTSNVVFQNGQLLRYDKRARLPEMTHIDYGVSLLRREALQRMPPDQPCDLADLYRDLVSEGQMAGHEVTERFYEIGSPRGLEETRAYLIREAA